MSEDFDKEAEREQLRRQLEAEEQAREATQHMSELLLKGATMTNKHCGDCGDPIFRFQGQEFCPTCEQPVENGETTGASANGGTEADEAPAEVDVTESPSPSADSGGESTPSTPRDATGTTETSTEKVADESGSASAPSGASVPDPGANAPTSVDQIDPDTDDLADARATLVRTLTTLARRAESTDDARRARDLLAAAREAAETIAAIDAAGR